MDFLSVFSDYGMTAIVALIIFSFFAGFFDSIVGGGGLISIPGLLISLPNTPLPTIFGTNKIAAVAGTSTSAIQYSQRIKFNLPLLIVISTCAGFAAFLGAKAVSFIHVNTLKPIILIILIAIAIYTFSKKDLGLVQSKTLSLKKQFLFGSFIGLVIGFYDGFFGPGSGSFFVLGFILILGFEFIQASAYSKAINSITQFSALLVFIKQGNYLLEIALLMGICNVSGNIIGTRLAIKKGNWFIRTIFLVIVSIMIIRYAYDIFI